MADEEAWRRRAKSAPTPFFVDDRRLDQLFALAKRASERSIKRIRRATLCLRAGETTTKTSVVAAVEILAVRQPCEAAAIGIDHANDCDRNRSESLAACAPLYRQINGGTRSLAANSRRRRLLRLPPPLRARLQAPPPLSGIDFRIAILGGDGGNGGGGEDRRRRAR